jgi:hypothetical protein
MCDLMECRPNGSSEGPVADAVSHVGQLAMMRRMAGVPIRGGNYYTADIA